MTRRIVITKRDRLEGPEYPDLGKKVEKARASGDRKAHGNAVLDAIRRLQTRELHDYRQSYSRDY